MGAGRGFRALRSGRFRTRVALARNSNSGRSAVERALESAEELVSIGERAVRVAVAAGAEEAEAFLTRAAGISVDIEGGFVRYPFSSRGSGIALRVVKGRRPGFAYCTRERFLRRTAERALDIARIERRIAIRFPDPAPLPRPPGIWDDRVPVLTGEDVVRLCAEMMGEARRVHRDIRVTGGGVDVLWSLSAVVNSRGVAVVERGTLVSGGLQVSLRGAVESTGFEYMNSRSLDIDFGRIGRLAAELALRGRNPVRAETRKTTALLMPEAAASLLSHITIPSLHGESVRRGESFYSGRMGERVAAQSLSIIDDGLLAGGLASSGADDEGVPSRRRALIDRGVLRGFVFDLRSAAEVGGESTGNGLRPSYRVPPVTAARNVIVEGRARHPEALISQIGDGVMVHELLGAHTASAHSGDFSVTAPVLFRIKRGELGPALKPVMLSGNLPALLTRVTGVGTDVRQVPAGLASIVTGTVGLEGVMMTA